MIAIPAVDLREGACVQLVGGAYDAERVRLPDPVEVARSWRARGFRRLHVVDLDAATGRGDNGRVIERLLAEADGEIQVGGGIRDEAAIDRWLEAGARSVVVGTRAIEDPDWLSEQARRHPGRLIVAADVRGREVVTRGWAEGSGLEIRALLERVGPLSLAGVLVTAVHREGRLEGTDLELMAEVARSAKAEVLASGGITRIEELRELARVGVAGAVLGMALYTGAMDAEVLARELGA